MARYMKRWQTAEPGRKNLRLADVPVPEPAPREVLIRVSAVSLNYRDRLFLDGRGYAEVTLPFTPASDMAGVIEATGPSVTRFAVGDRVMGTFIPGWVDGPPPLSGLEMPPSLGGRLPGVLAQYVVLHEDALVAAPASLHDSQASTLPIAAVTAWTSLVELGSVRPGQTVVVQGTGGVSLFAIQFAAAAGATVIVTSSSDAKLSRAKALGATHGINRNTTPDWARAVRSVTGGRGADHILEMVGGDNLAQSLDALAPGGRISVIGLLGDTESRFGAIPIFRTQAVIQGVTVGHRRAFEEMVRAIDERSIKPVIDAEYPLEELGKALDHLDRGPFGKVVVRVHPAGGKL